MNDKTDILSVCANCGKGEEESGGKLKSCAACKLVKYCSRECQQAHRPQHKKECRKRAKELHDEELFKQPPSQHGDCPICFLRIPSLTKGWGYQTCCGTIICSGCVYAPVYDNQGNKVDNEKQNECAFCRTPAPYTQEEAIERVQKRAEAGDAVAIRNLGRYYRKGMRGFKQHGAYYRDGIFGFPQDHKKALELWHRAAKLGCAEAYCDIGNAYHNGEGVDIDLKKAIHYYELAAMMGNASARYNLGVNEESRYSMDRALKHHMIAARSGLSESLDIIKQFYSDGHATKDDYTKALKSYQEYLSEIKSDKRDEAAAAHEEFCYH